MIPRAPKLPLTGMDHQAFEEMVAALLRAEISAGRLEGDEVVHLPEGRDGGRDIVVYADGRIIKVIQCKQVRSAISAPSVLRELVGFVLQSIDQGRPQAIATGVAYQLWTATNISAPAMEFMASPGDLFATDLPAAIQAVRRKFKQVGRTYAGMSVTDTSAIDERVRDACEGLFLSHVGPVVIGELLQANSDVRRHYFADPDDVIATATVSEIDALMASRRLRQLAAFESKGMSKADPYVRPGRLDTSFAAFLGGSRSLFALVGANGRGKSRWAKDLLEDACSQRTWIIDASEIHRGDSHVLETLSRLLKRDGLDPRLAANLTQALRKWFGQSDHLLVIDALDRTASDTIERIDGWLERTLELVRQHAHRCVLISRPEAWKQRSVALFPFRGDFHPHDAWDADMGLPAWRFGALDLDEASEIYKAYGLPAPGFRQRHLRTPALIRLLAELEEAGRGHTGSRARVLKSFVDEVATDAATRVSIGRIVLTGVLKKLGLSLLDRSDGWIELDRDPSLEPVAGILDALARIDFIEIVDGRMRPSSDDVIEYLIGHVLDLDEELRDIRSTSLNDLRLGSLAIAAGLAERRDPSGTANLLRRFWQAAGPSDETKSNVLIECMLELDSHIGLEDVIGAQFADWSKDNLLLFAYPLGDLARSLRLPPAIRIVLLSPLFAHEDERDWRVKFWLDPTRPDRHITLLASVAEAAAVEDPVGVTRVLEPQLLNEGVAAEVARGLVRDAFIASPQGVLSHLSPRIGTTSFFEQLLRLRPTEGAAFLAAIDIGDDVFAENAAALLCSLAELALRDLGSAGALDMAFVRAADRLSASVRTPYGLSRLALVRHLAVPTSSTSDELLAHFDSLYGADLWRAVNASPMHGAKLLDMLFERVSLDLHRLAPLSLIGVLDVPPGMLNDIGQRMIEAYRNQDDDKVKSAIAEAVEHLLRMSGAGARLPAVWDLAERMAVQGSDKERRFLLLYAGSLTSRGKLRDAWLVERRNRLFDLVLEHWQGADLEFLLAKVLEKSIERPEVAEWIPNLAMRFGTLILQRHLEHAVIMARSRGQLPSRTIMLLAAMGEPSWDDYGGDGE